MGNLVGMATNGKPDIGEALMVRKMPHVRELDGLRAVAIGTVFLGHTDILPKFPGGFGVTIFFFLSGFLITTLLRIEKSVSGTISLKQFYIRRFLRINPPLWLSMLFVGLMGYFQLFPMQLDPFQVAGQAFFFTNYIMPESGDGRLPIPLWSLAVEEHFYLVFPALYLIVSARSSARKIALGCAALCLAVLFGRIFTTQILGVYYEVYYWTHTRIDSILFGCILALWRNPLLDRDAWRPKLVHAGLAIALIMVTFVFRSPDFREGLRYSLQGIALFVIFSYVLQEKGLLSAFLTSAPMQLIGLYSYTLYLVHFAMLLAVEHSLPSVPHLPRVILAGIAAIAFAAVMHKFVERPLARLRHKLNKVEDSDPRLGTPAT